MPACAALREVILKRSERNLISESEGSNPAVPARQTLFLS
jgi:hypothetical protein